MPCKPAKALSQRDLDFHGREGVAKSGHAVSRVSFEHEGKTVTGFFKPCDKETYPPLLAKYDVAFSIDYQFSGLGQQRAPLSKLVFNDRDEIIGSVSIALPNFISLQAGNSRTTQKKQPYLEPSESLLLSSNAVRVLIAAWRRKEDDLHDENIGFITDDDLEKISKAIFVSIDRDMSYWPLTSYIKGRRFQEETPLEPIAEAKLGKLDKADLLNFPMRQSTPHFWVTDTPPVTSAKSNPCAESFRALSPLYPLHNPTPNPEFQSQTHMALLLELLAFQPLALLRRLKAELGDIPIDLQGFADLGPKQALKKEMLVKRDKGLFIDGEGAGAVEKSFLDHVTCFLTKEYEEFYKTVALEYSPFRDFLIQTPTALDEALSYFKHENSTLPPDQQFNLGYIEQTFQKIWRDSAKLQLANGVHKIVAAIEVLNKYVSLANKLVIEVREVDGQAVLIDRHASRETTVLVAAQQCLESLYKGYTDLTAKYNKKENLTLEDNQTYVKACRKLINKQRAQLQQDREFEKLEPRDIKNIIDCFSKLEEIVTSVDYKPHEEERELSRNQAAPYRATTARTTARTKYSFKGGARSLSPTLFKPFALNSVTINQIQSLLAQWLCQQDFPDLKVHIQRAMSIYQSRSSKTMAKAVSSLFGWVSKAVADVVEATASDREPEVREIIKRTDEEIKRGVRISPHYSLTVVMDLFLPGKGGWQPTSFNTQLLKIILPLAVNATARNVELVRQYPNIKGIKSFVDSQEWISQVDIVSSDISKTLESVLDKLSKLEVEPSV